MSNIDMDIKTVITLWITSMGVPWLASKGLNLDPSQTMVVSGMAVAALTTIVHFFESKAKSLAGSTSVPTVKP